MIKSEAGYYDVDSKYTLNDLFGNTKEERLKKIDNVIKGFMDGDKFNFLILNCPKNVNNIYSKGCYVEQHFGDDVYCGYVFINSYVWYSASVSIARKLPSLPKNEETYKKFVSNAIIIFYLLFYGRTELNDICGGKRFNDIMILKEHIYNVMFTSSYTLKCIEFLDYHEESHNDVKAFLKTFIYQVEKGFWKIGSDAPFIKRPDFDLRYVYTDLNTILTNRCMSIL